MSEWFLAMKGICKNFPGTQALSDAEFYLKKGEIHGLIGENGAGKSTLMNILIGIHKMDKGEILLNGKKIENNHPHEALLKGIAMVPQEINLVTEVSVAENIFIGNELSRYGLINWKNTEKQAKELLEKLDVMIDVNQKLTNLSAAYQQMVSIARSLAVGSSILIMDEPTAALTESETECLFRSMSQLRSEGKSIIFVSHRLEQVKKICDRVTIMRDGKIVHTDDIRNLSIDEMIFYMVNRRIEKLVKEYKKFDTDEVFLEVRDFTRKNEFENVSFNVHKGEILGIAGLVGAGRTELFKAIYGITRKDSGKIFLEGREIDINSTAVAINKGIGYVPEERRVMGIFPVLSVAENIIIPLYRQFTKAGFIIVSKIRNCVSKYVKELQIKTPSNEQKIKDLSGGNQQKVILARWMVKGVKILILDEPTRGIDVNAKAEIHKLIRKMVSEGAAVVVISSEIEEVFALADRIMVLHEGKVKGFIDNLQDSTQEDILKIALQ